jgi:uncharacterized membrane-anchored protein
LGIALADFYHRPLGATLGDFFGKPLVMGGLNSSRFYATLALIAFIVVCIRVLPQKPGEHRGARGAAGVP